MNNAWTIAEALDHHLSAPTEIIVYGAAALLLDRQLAEYLIGRRTNDIDIIVPASREMQIDADRQFWQSIESTFTAIGTTHSATNAKPSCYSDAP